MKTHLTLALSALLVTLAAGAARGQEVAVLVPDADPANWGAYAPAGEGFSVLIPGVPRRETLRKRLANGKTVTVYVHLVSWFAEYGVIHADNSATGARPETAKQILHDAAKGAAARHKAELLDLSEITLDGRPGFALKQRLPDGKTLRARLYLDGMRLYQVSVLTPDEKGAPASDIEFNERLAAKFLGSFKLTGTRAGESSAAPPTDAGPAAEGEVDRLLNELKAKDDGVLVGLCPDIEDCKPPESDRLKVGTVISRPAPAYPHIARAARAQGAVRVQLIVDEEGKVIAAQAVGGHPLLQVAAVRAAREARFTPTLLDGKPRKVAGVITYNFVLQ